MNLPGRTPKRYRVFLSYKHDDNRDADRLWANWLKTELERYQVPPDLIGESNRRGEPIPPTLAPVFRDEDCLGAVSDIGEWIIYGLQRSEALICLCSPRSARSSWVRDELKRFKEMGKSDRIQALVLDGQPRASEGNGAQNGATEGEECFAEELLHGVPDSQRTTPEGHPIIDWSARAEPLWADFRPKDTRTQGFTSSGAYRQLLEDCGNVPVSDIDRRVAEYEGRLRDGVRKLVAGILGVDLDDLESREAEHRAEQARKEAEEAQLRADLAQAEVGRNLARFTAARARAALLLCLAIIAGMVALVAIAFYRNEEQQRRSAEASEKKSRFPCRRFDKPMPRPAPRCYVRLSCIYRVRIGPKRRHSSI